MNAWKLLPLVILLPGFAAVAADRLPIAGRWAAEPSPDYVGSSNLMISDQVISFGSDRERVTGWHQEAGTIDIETATGREYVFRQDSPSHICLEVGVRPASGASVTGKAAIRCFSKRADS